MGLGLKHLGRIIFYTYVCRNKKRITMRDSIDVEYKKVLIFKTKIDYLKSQLKHTLEGGCQTKEILSIRKELELLEKKFFDYILYQNH